MERLGGPKILLYDAMPSRPSMHPNQILNVRTSPRIPITLSQTAWRGHHPLAFCPSNRPTRPPCDSTGHPSSMSGKRRLPSTPSCTRGPIAGPRGSSTQRCRSIMMASLLRSAPPVEDAAQPTRHHVTRRRSTRRERISHDAGGGHDPGDAVHQALPARREAVAAGHLIALPGHAFIPA
jgi:hypothetical protein